MRLHQLLSGAGPVDAVTTQARLWRDLFAGWGIEGEIYADLRDPAVGKEVRPAKRLERELGPSDVLLVQYSAYGRRTGEARDLPNRLLLAYHNITPDRYLWDHEPLTAALCASARRELPRFASTVHAAAAVSDFNAEELRQMGFGDVAVVPNLLDFSRLSLNGVATRERSGAEILFVGRVSPHKRHDLLIRAVALLRERHVPEAGLTCVGPALSGRFVTELEELAAELAVPVRFTGPIGQAELNALYAGAGAFLCLSEHEGFCIPLVEAMHFGLPVVAARAGAIGDVAGDAAVLLSDRDPSVAAEALAIVLADEEAGRELAERGRRRAAEFSVEAAAPRLRAWIETALG